MNDPGAAVLLTVDVGNTTLRVDAFDRQAVHRALAGDVRDPARAAATQCQRKTLRARQALAHGAPASRANAQAFSASGRTSGAMAAALALVAVPSRTRPTMPCRMAARRKKL